MTNIEKRRESLKEIIKVLRQGQVLVSQAIGTFSDEELEAGVPELSGYTWLHRALRSLEPDIETMIREIG